MSSAEGTAGASRSCTINLLSIASFENSTREKMNEHFFLFIVLFDSLYLSIRVDSVGRGEILTVKSTLLRHRSSSHFFRLSLQQFLSKNK